MVLKNILQTIFSDHFEYIQYVIRPNKNVLDNINRMILCHDPSYGGAFFGCPHCGNLKFVPFSCKSRFCPSCGSMYNQKRAFRMSCKLVSCNHRHCVFTIPVKYISRYLGRPVIATSRIDAYDGNVWRSIISAMRIIKQSQNASLPLTLSNGWSYISLTGTLKWSATTAFMQNTINRKKISGNVYPLRSGNIFPDYWTGVIRFFWPLAMIRSDARSVALLCWF